MSEEDKGTDINIELSDDSENEEELDESAPKKGGKKKIIIIAIIALVILAGGGAGLFFTGFFDKKDESVESENVEGQDTKTEKEKEKKEQKEQEDIFVDMEEFIVNLTSENSNPSFLKMTVTIHVKGKDEAGEISAQTPVIRDMFQIYLRELRSEDLKGSAGVFRLKEELLLRINKALYPTKVEDILFKEILVQ